MRVISAALTAHFALPSTSIASYFHVVRVDGAVYGWTSHDVSQAIDSVVFSATSGLQTTTVHHTDDMRVNTMDVTVFLDASTEAAIAAGVWDDATVTLFEANWRNLPAVLFDTDCHVILHGTLGVMRRQDLQLLAEIRGLSHTLNNRIGAQYSWNCRYRHARWNGTTYEADVWCGAVLTSHIHDGSITSVGANPRLIASDSASTQVSAYYQDGGLLTFTSGANSGITREVAIWAPPVLTFGRPFPYVIAIGHTYRAVRGDPKNPGVCKDVYNNLVNYGGEPTVPGRDKIFGLPQVIP
jgi:uncharacterized phage protein (TIGR02218 family)